MKITVKQEHIDSGSKACHDRCPVALAVKDALEPLAVDVGVTGFYIRVNESNYQAPPEVQSFIYSFDHGEHVHPFAFELKRW